MLFKLASDILDRLDIFILEIEELEIPKPLLWEYIWSVSLLASFAGLSAAQENKVRSMQKFMVAILFLSVAPLLYCFAYYFTDVWEYVTLEEGADIQETGIILWRVKSRIFFF